MIQSRRFALHRWCRPVALAVYTSAACTTASNERAVPPRAVPAQVSAAQFAALSWLEGRWRGADSAGQVFFESYAALSPTLIRTFTYPDSGFGAPTDSGAIELRGDTLFSGSLTMRWVATQLDSTGVRFAPWRGASNSFAWRRVEDGGWTATLQWDSASVPLERVYRMSAIR